MKTPNEHVKFYIQIAIAPLFVIAILFAGCQSINPTDELIENDPPVETTSSPVATRAVASPKPTSTSAPTSTPEGQPITLTFWTVEEISAQAEGDAGVFFDNSIKTFDRANPDVEVNVLVKKPGGKGGILDFLRTSKKAAPSVMPDVVIIRATDLDQAYFEGLIQPLDGKLDRAIIKDLLPASRRVGTVEDALVGVPLGLEMEHTVYNTGVFTAAPVIWTDVLSRNTDYLFPAKGVNGIVNDVTLSQYLSAGGVLLDEDEIPTLDERALRDVLSFYEQANAQGLIDAVSLESAITEDLWPTYLAGQAGLTQVNVRQYLTDRDQLNNSLYSPLPIQSETGTPVGVMHAWVLVLVTDDVGRHDAALRLIESFLSTGNNAEWNSINKSIPVRDTAYQELAGDDPYWEFLTNQLNTAQPEPRFAGYDKLGRIMQQAVEQIIRDGVTAEEATTTAMDALTK